MHCPPQHFWLYLILCSFCLTTNALTTSPITGKVEHFQPISIEQGLSQSSVFATLEDHQGFIWIATEDGLNRYDGYEFKVFNHQAKDPHSISDNTIYSLFEDQSGQLWVGTRHGLNRFERHSERFIRYEHDSTDPNSISDNTIMAITSDPRGNLWIGTMNGLNRLDQQTNQFIRYEPPSQNPTNNSNDNIRAIINGLDHDLWLATDDGLNHFNPDTGKFKRYLHHPNNPLSLSNNGVVSLAYDSKLQLWVGTENGLNRFDSKTQTFKRYYHQVGDSRSLSHNRVHSLYNDDKGNLWIGTFGGGINRYLAELDIFHHNRYDSTNPNSLSADIVWSINQDSTGALWLGTRGGGVNIYNPRQQRFNHIKHHPQITGSLNHNEVWSIYFDSNKQLWVGTTAGLNRYDEDRNRFVQYQPQSLTNQNSKQVLAITEDRHNNLWFGSFGGGLTRIEQQAFIQYQHHPDEPTSLSNNNVSTLLSDQQGRLWVGTLSGGLNLYHPDTDSFTRFVHDPSNPNSLLNNMITAIFVDSQQQLWIGTRQGINRFDFDNNQFINFRQNPNVDHSLSNNTILTIAEDRQGQLWFGTMAGLNRYNRQTDSFSHFSKQDGLPNETIYSILEDQQGHLWFSTNRGISKYDPDNQQFKNYNADDGLQSNEFNTWAYFHSPEGEMFFGGINGFNHFNPQDIVDDTQPPKVALTQFLVANQIVEINPQTSEKFSLPMAINELQTLNLDYHQNLITFEFSALHFANPSKNRYAYRLDGWDEQWLYTDAKNRRATYTNIPAGDYSLEIKAANPDGYWSKEIKSLEIIITPPPWKTWWAYTIYLLASTAILWLFIRSQRQKILAQQAINQRLTQVDRLKDEFLANTSHELRTPLNGIIGLTESIIDGATGPLSEQTKSNLAMVVSSGRRLSNLINDVLDFSKLKHHNLVLNSAPVDIFSLTEVVMTLSTPLIENKNLKLVNAIPKEIPAVYADENRLIQILHNLIGNGIKFTDSGEVRVSVELNEFHLTIKVSDTGIGIDQSQLSRIFNSFEQIDNEDQHDYHGSGLGLSVSKQLVALHGGKLQVKSTLHRGSCFYFDLPITPEKASSNTMLSQKITRLHALEPAKTTPEQSTTIANENPKRWRILLVDDEPINLQVLHNHLSLHQYQLVQADNGNQALQLIDEQKTFDLVLLDIMMPKMSGYQVCRQIRQQYSANDLPVIFLTAKNQVADMVESFAVGANDFLTKPINKHELLTRVETHLKFLAIHRDLESKVKERTAVLEQKNQEIINAQQQLLQTEKMASLGTLTAGVAHEINNPTNFVYVAVRSLADELLKAKQFLLNLAGDEADEAIIASFNQLFEPLNLHVNTIKEGSLRIKSIVEALQTFTQHDCAERKTAIITELLQATVELVKAQNHPLVAFKLEFDSHPQLKCYPAQLNELFLHLLSNACDAIAVTQKPGIVTISCRQRGEHIEIKIKDNGCGMDKQTKSKLFEPFYTTKPIGQGTGLGLSIAYGIVQHHGGELKVDSQLGVGTELSMNLLMVE